MSKILIVDDDEIMREMLMQMMAEAGYDVSSASDGIRAQQACKNENFDLAIIDMVMPGQDGLVTVSNFALHHSRMKIIAISGGDRSFDGTTYLALVKDRGAHKIFTKPFDRKEFLKAVDELLGTEK